MEFGIFYEHQLPRPWNEGDEEQLIQDALDQVELADELGIDYAWEVEHHFLEEYSHSSAPEVFLAAAARNTEQIHLGHGIKLMPPDYNPPARVAEEVATLDLVSEGRVEWGTGESASRTELEGFGVPPEEKFEMWQETTEQAANMMTMEPYPGYDGEFFEMPSRNVLPKPKQDPHPPLWVACSSREMIEVAARHGMGALCFAFTDPQEAEQWVDTYYETFKEECVPIGHSVNPNVAMVTGFSCHEDEEVARERGEEGFAFFRYALAHYYVFGDHVPGETNVWEEFQAAGGVDALPEEEQMETAIGTPEQIREHLRGFEEAGVDQVIFVQQGGNNEHEHICESLELFAEEVMPEFEARHAKHQRRKQEELEPYVERAMERKERMEPMDPDEVPVVHPYGREETADD
jgi:alkanesulfonate monooxygenase SsuD/methylene tetrahydromethanopterin reductase-like flavin-dependent oxidoreductase (luciferase family)